MTPRLWAVSAAVVVLGVLSAQASTGGARRTAATLKMSAATGYVLLSLWVGASESSFGRVMLAGFALCWIGDLLLIVPGRGQAFLCGLAAFLVGHLAYATAFASLGFQVQWAAAAFVFAVPTALWIHTWLIRSELMPRMIWPVRAYIVAISLMLVMAASAFGAGAPLLVPVGAAAFMASDVFVARERFVQRDPLNTGVGLPLYFLAQVLFALGL
jgi:uncharacterized membrane protein YhhN